MAVTPPPPTGPSPAAGLSAGALLGGRYRLGEQLASGGMAQVWLGTDEVLRRAIAVKVLHQHLAEDQTFVTRFRREAIAVARLSHPAIVNVYDTCSDDGVEAIVMELVRGHTLRQRLDEGPIESWAAGGIAAQVAGALAVAHGAGLVHRDIKPANILLSEDGRVKVGDFGIAKAAESADLTQEGSFLGTAKYLAPEQVEGNPVDGRSDLYSLGVVLYEMLCGRVPFEADTASATALARLHHDPQRPRLVKPGVPRELESITMRLLARSPDDRYPTATDARAALLSAGVDDRAAAADATAADPAPRPGSAPPPPGGVPTPQRTPAVRAGEVSNLRFADTERSWLVPTLVVVLVAVGLGVAGLLIRGSGADLFQEGEPGDMPSLSAPAAAPVSIARTIDFDPQGDGAEHADEAARTLAADDDPATSWRTEEYGRRPDREWGGLKDGVGLILELAEPAGVRAVEIDSPHSGWSAEIYIADGSPGSLEGWGAAVAEIADAQPDEGTIRTEFDPVDGSSVLIWFTRQGGNVQMEISEARVER